jgi:serine/threonine protein kinase
VRRRANTACSESEFKFPEFDSTYRPMDYSELESYKEEKVLYDLPLAPAKVQLVSEEGSEKKFVKKTINKEYLNDTHKALARQECVIQSQMEHKNIVKLHKFAETENTIELLMDYVNDGSFFEDRLEESSEPIEDNDKLRQYAKEALEAIAYIHAKGIIHADIKLSNLGLQRDGDSETLKVFDFGLSLLVESQEDQQVHLNHSVGTFGYMAPELKQNEIVVDPKIDIWSFGICLYKMCVGYAPEQVPRYNYGKVSFL